MRPLVITQNMTVDGSIEMLDDWFDATGITDELNRMAKYVVSATLTDPAWQHSAILAGDPVAAVRELKQSEGAEISLTGSIQLCHALIAAGLVDEYRIWTFPYAQGRGRGLFPDGHHERLELLEHHAFSSHVTYARWAPRKDPS